MRIRFTVFVDEQKIPRELEQDNWDEKSKHVLLSMDGQDVGTGRLLPNGYIGRVCVIKEFRGNGLGRLLMEALIERAKEDEMKEVQLSSQISALDFYEALGFQKVSDEYMEAGIPHVKMKLEI